MPKHRVLVLGAGFAGLELSAVLSEELGDDLDLTLIDKSDSFVFGYSKLDLMFGRLRPEEVRVPYRSLRKSGVRFRQDTVTAVDPETRRVTTERDTYTADTLVLALGADYEPSATPGLTEGGNEFYSVRGAEKVRQLLPKFSGGRVIVGVTSVPFKCPPAPSETVLMLHDYLSERGVRSACEISLVTPLPAPIPPSPETSRALLEAFAERGIKFIPGRRVQSLEPKSRVAVLDDGTQMPYDLFLGIPKHRVPDVIAKSGMLKGDWVPVDPANLKTPYTGVYAIGDLADVEVPMAGVFAEGTAKVAAASILADMGKRKTRQEPYDGAGSCYIEFGAGRVARVDMNFLSGPVPKGVFTEPSKTLAREKSRFGSSRRSRWFGGAFVRPQ